MKFTGNNGQVEVLEDRLIITRKGLIGFLTQGFKGEKTIPFSSISAVQFREPGAIVLGYIQFSIMGAPESSNPATDENTVNFTNGRQHQDFVKLKEHMDGVLFNQTKICPQCAETIKAAAKICRYCGHQLGVS
ncbi:MAG: zinc ribbon domain-containing protein [Pseudolabrys sp.]